MQSGLTVHWRQIGSSLESGERRVDMRNSEHDVVRGFLYFCHIVRLWRARRRVDGVSSGGFTLKLMKLTLQGPSLPQAPSKTPKGVLPMS